MSLLESREVWRAVDTLSLGDSPEPPAEIHSFEDGAVALVSDDISARSKALRFLGEANRQAKVPWGGPTVFLVFYYHTLFESRDLEAADELRKLLTNCTKLGSITSIDNEIFQVLLAGHSLLEANLPRQALRSNALKVGPKGLNVDPLIALIAGLVSAKLGGLVNIEPLVRAARQETKEFDVSAEVAEAYFVPTFASKQPFDNYFIVKATLELEQQSGRRALLRLGDNQKAIIKEKTQKIKQKRKLEAFFFAVFAGLGIVLSIVYAKATTSPSADNYLASVVVAAIFAINSLSIWKMPNVALSMVAYAYTIPERVNLFYTNKDMSKLEELNEP